MELSSSLSIKHSLELVIIHGGLHGGGRAQQEAQKVRFVDCCWTIHLRLQLLPQRKFQQRACKIPMEQSHEVPKQLLLRPH